MKKSSVGHSSDGKRRSAMAMAAQSCLSGRRGVCWRDTDLWIIFLMARKEFVGAVLDIMQAGILGAIPAKAEGRKAH